MDDRFLARGKRKDNGKWIEGDLIRSKGLYYIHPLSNGVTVKNTLGRLIVMHEIDPSTLGWYINLTDLNGKKIFEGDILSAEWLNKIITGIVMYSDLQASVALLKDDEYFWFEDDIYCNSYEVIGNIHDNPDMLSRADMPVSDDISQPVLAPATPENFEIFPA